MVTHYRFASPEEAWGEFTGKFTGQPALKAVQPALVAGQGGLAFKGQTSAGRAG